MTGFFVNNVSEKTYTKRIDTLKVESCDVTKKQNHQHVLRNMSALVCIGLILVSSILTIVLVKLDTSTPGGAKDIIIKSKEMHVRTKDGHTITQTIITRGEDEDEVHVPGQGSVVYDYKNFLMVMHLENARDVCFVTHLNDTIQARIDLSETTEMAEPDYVEKIWYKTAGISVVPNHLPTYAQAMCQQVVWVEQTNSALPASTRREKRRACEFCVSLCIPQRHNRRGQRCTHMCPPCFDLRP